MLLPTRYKMKPPLSARLTHPLLCRGLIGSWRCNAGSGNKVFDSSVHGLDFIYKVGQNFPDWDTGKYGTSLLFNGIDQHLYRDSFPTVPLPWTMNFVLRFPAVGADERIIDFATGRLIFQLDDSKTLRIYEGSWNTSAVVILADKWYNIAVVGASATSCMFYINGVAENIIVDALTGLGGSCAVGSHSAGDSNFSSVEISHFSIWDRVLSASEVTLLCADPFCIAYAKSKRYFVVPTVAAAGHQRHIGFKPIEGPERIRGLLRSA